MKPKKTSITINVLEYIMVLVMIGLNQADIAFYIMLLAFSHTYFIFK